MRNEHGKVEVLLTPKEVADDLKIGEKTLANWRWSRQGPPYVRIGSGPRALIRYRESELWAWVNDPTELRDRVD